MKIAFGIICMIFVSGCSLFGGNLQTSPIGAPSNTDDVTSEMTNSEPKKYTFVFPATGWYMDFNYAKGFELIQHTNSLEFVLVDGSVVVFGWQKADSPVGSVERGNEFIGKGWWGTTNILEDGSTTIAFNTPDNKYVVTVNGVGDEFDLFVQGMVLGK